MINDLRYIKSAELSKSSSYKWYEGKSVQMGKQLLEFEQAVPGDHMYVTNYDPQSLVDRNVQQEQTIKALQEQLSKLTAQNQRPVQEYGMQTDRRQLWSHKDQLLLKQLTDGQENINWSEVQQQFPGRTVPQLKSHYKNQQRKDQIVWQQQQIQALQQQNTAATQYAQNVEWMYQSFKDQKTIGTGDKYTFRDDNHKREVAQYAVANGWVRSSNTYIKYDEQQNQIANGVNNLVKELLAK